MSNFKERILKLRPPQALLIVFVLLILLGTLILKLPIATTEGITWLESLFTATSAMTVTGLVVVDTGQAFTLFGEIVILALIQVSGLGIMTFAVLIFLALGRKIGVKERLLIQEATNQNSLDGITGLMKHIFIFSLIMETISTVILTLKWGPTLGWVKGLYSAFFYSVSAFNNAGFSIWSDSLSSYVTDPIVNIVIPFLFIVGGLGFTVIFDLYNKKKLKHLSLQTKLMLVGTLIINIIAFILILTLEFNNPKTISHLSSLGKIQAAFFQSVTPRTAGFNTINIGDLNEPTQFFMLFLMFVGAGSTSTGGGIKLTTFLALILSTLSFLKSKEEIVIFKRAISDKTIRRSLAISLLSLLVIFLSTFVLTLTEESSFMEIIFEITSAFGTVGLSMGLTENLSVVGQFVIIFIMILGKLGPLTLAFSFANPHKAHIKHPKEDIMTG